LIVTGQKKNVQVFVSGTNFNLAARICKHNMAAEDGGSCSVDDGLGNAEACCQLINHEALFLCVRKMCDHQGETCIPRYDVPVALVV
ncbi:unnamed protein product, partial [Ascophyllum nodosum]